MCTQWSLNPIKLSNSVHKLSIVKGSKIFVNFKPKSEGLLMSKVNMAVDVKFAITPWMCLSLRYNQFSLQGIYRRIQLGSVYLRTNLAGRDNLWNKYECRQTQTDRQIQTNYTKTKKKNKNEVNMSAESTSN